jgi:hypothetical protein
VDYLSVNGEGNMPIFKIRYTEMQERLWVLTVEAESLKEAEQLFEANNTDPWLMSTEENVEWDLGSGDDEGEAIDTYDTNWEIEESV